MHSMYRRMVLKGTIAMGAAVTAGLFTPLRALAEWPKTAFEAEAVEGVIKSLYAASSVQDSDQIRLIAPDIAENGTVVPITVDTTLPEVDSISIIAEKNPRPLAASSRLNPKLEGYFATRLKLSQTQNVVAVVQSRGRLYRASKEIKVTVGGCGG
ncbi:MAG: thiosulfate oxidation carrier protein SoxY [Gammaproteobacteria bacterium]|nr:thiosulfate oxidation carrier protein SoxY [Gammaproteobacteria bacterium]